MANAPFTVVQISDLHLDPADSEQCARLDVLRAAVNAAEPDFLVISGDISADGFRNDGMFRQVKSELEKFGKPFHVIPGNHDVGDKPGERYELRREYLTSWKSVFSSDRFDVQRGDWRILGINTLILGSGLREEADQFEWLDDRLDMAARENHQVALFLHAAAYLFEPEEQLTGPSRYWGFDPFPRRELLKRTGRQHVKFVSNGHLHWHHVFRRSGVLHVWCPATSFIVDDAIFPRGGGVLGFMRYCFGPTQVQHELVPLDLPGQIVLFHRRQVELPGRDPITMAELVLDFTGTLSKDGQLLPGVAPRLVNLARRIRITVISADTFGTAQTALAELPLEIRLIKTGRQKRNLVEELDAKSVVAIGNGRNDIDMLGAAAIGIAVVGPEGAAAELLRCADVVTHDICDALDLVANPLRLTATLRD